MNEIVTTTEAGQLARAELMHKAGQAANRAAARGVFADYQERKAENSRRRHAADLATFTEFLMVCKLTPGDLLGDPEAWRGISWGIVESFKRWMLAEGYAVSTVNFKLSTVKVYAKLAMKAAAITTQEYAMIRAVEGYSHKEFIHVDETRADAGQATRKGTKKADAVSITRDQARQLKAQPDTPQGRRDAVLMTILLDHGLRCGEVALLQVESFDLEGGFMNFYRPKVQKWQTHKLGAAALKIIKAYLENDNPMLTGPLLLATTKGGHRGEGGGKLGKMGMTERAITRRVEYLGGMIGVSGLSAHDCRHYWATQAARNGTHIERLKDAGGWSSLAMPGRYIEAAKIANEGVKLGDD